MSIPFSNTTLRVPRGFGNLLEGLAREVLRNQPKDIPTFAALYFSGLLKQREESGLDPAEWGAKLEDRFYNNHAFQQEREKETDGRTEPQQEAVETIHENSVADTPGFIEEEMIQPVQIATIATANFNIFDDVTGVESVGPPSIGSKASEDICGAELGPSPVAPYGAIADMPGGLGVGRYPSPKGDFDLSTALGTPSPLSTHLQVPGGIPAVGSPGSLLLDFTDNETGQTPDSIPAFAVEETPVRVDIAEDVRAELPERPEAVLKPREGQDEDSPSFGVLGLSREEDPSLGRGSPGKEDPPFETALDPAREDSNTGEDDGPESIQPQKTGTEETIDMAEATSRDIPPQNSTGMKSTSDNMADDDDEQDAKEDINRDANAVDANAESDKICDGDVQNDSMEKSITAEEQVTKESEGLGQDIGCEKQEQGKESDEQEQVNESEDLNQRAELEEQNQGAESEEQEQSKSEELSQGAELGEQGQGKSEEQNQDAGLEQQEQGKSEEQTQDVGLEEQEQGKSEEQIQGAGLEQQEQSKSEEQTQDAGLEEQEQGKSEEQNQGAELGEQEQGKTEEKNQDAGLEEQGKSEEQNQGAELEEQVSAAITEHSVDETEPKEEQEDVSQNMDERNDSDKQDPAKQEEEKVVPVGGQEDHKAPEEDSTACN